MNYTNPQTKRIELHFILHGGIVLLLGMFLGIPYGQSINRELGVDVVRAWKAVHLAALTLILLIPIPIS